MLTLMLFASFAVTVLTGPAFDDWRAERRRRAGGWPHARVMYLPSAACRSDRSCYPGE